MSGTTSDIVWMLLLWLTCILSVLQHINDMSMAIHLEETLKKAEGIFLQLKNARHLPDSVKEILGFILPSSAGSGSSTPVVPPPPVTTTAAPSTSQFQAVTFSKGQSARLQLQNIPSENGNQSPIMGSDSNTPDDSSIEILSDNCNSTNLFVNWS